MLWQTLWSGSEPVATTDSVLEDVIKLLISTPPTITFTTPKPISTSPAIISTTPNPISTSPAIISTTPEPISIQSSTLTANMSNIVDPTCMYGLRNANKTCICNEGFMRDELGSCSVRFVSVNPEASDSETYGGVSVYEIYNDLPPKTVIEFAVKAENDVILRLNAYDGRSLRIQLGSNSRISFEDIYYQSMEKSATLTHELYDSQPLDGNEFQHFRISWDCNHFLVERIFSGHNPNYQPYMITYHWKNFFPGFTFHNFNIIRRRAIVFHYLHLNFSKYR